MLAALVLVAAGCRSVPLEPGPLEASRTYRAATELDPEPHVLTITVLPPTRDWDFTTPRTVRRSSLVALPFEAAERGLQACAGRTFGFHAVGHSLIELKSIDPATGRPRYLLTAVTDEDDTEEKHLIFRDQIGLTFLDQGSRGKIQEPEVIGRILDEPAELGVRAARLRVLLTPATADRLFAYFEEFRRRRIYEHFALTSYPLRGDGAGCIGFAVSFLDAAGLLDPTLEQAWRVTLRVPADLYGDPQRGVRVPPRKLFFGLSHPDWPGDGEPYRVVSFFDTTALYHWIVNADRCAEASAAPSAVEVAQERFLHIPVVTLDARSVPTPTGPIFQSAAPLGSGTGPYN